MENFLIVDNNKNVIYSKNSNLSDVYMISDHENNIFNDFVRFYASKKEAFQVAKDHFLNLCNLNNNYHCVEVSKINIKDAQKTINNNSILINQFTVIKKIQGVK